MRGVVSRNLNPPLLIFAIYEIALNASVYLRDFSVDSAAMVEADPFVSTPLCGREAVDGCGGWRGVVLVAVTLWSGGITTYETGIRTPGS
jgi:hypothetical protein